MRAARQLETAARPRERGLARSRSPTDGFPVRLSTLWAPAPLPKLSGPPARMASHDRLLVPDVRQGNAPAHPVGRGRSKHSGYRTRWRDQGAHPRTRWQSHRREDVPAARHIHRRARDQPGLSQTDRAPVPRPGLHGRHRSPAQSRDIVNQVRPWIGPHRDLTNRCNMR